MEKAECMNHFMSRSGPGLAAILGKEAARCLKIDYLSFLVSLKANPGVAAPSLFKASKKLAVAVKRLKRFLARKRMQPLVARLICRVASTMRLLSSEAGLLK